MGQWWRRGFAALLACAGAIGTAQAVDEKDLLPVDQAFALTASAPARDRVRLQWKIADGYYLYRQRMSVQATDGTPLGTLQLPAGDRHTDPFFGEVETYRHLVQGTLPLQAAGDRVTLQVKYQGCADAGVCYPPQKRLVTVVLPAGDAGTPPSPPSPPGSNGDGLSGLARALGGAPVGGPLQGTQAAEALPLPPEQAFGFEAIAADGNTLLLRFTPAKGYYLYRDKTALRLQDADGIAPGMPRWPPGTPHRDEHFGNVVVYFDQVDVPLPLVRTRADAADLTLVATFQGCQTGGICYPPMTRTVRVSVPAGVVGGSTANRAPAGAPSASSAARTLAASSAIVDDGAASLPLAEDSRLAQALAGSNRAWTLLGFFGAGLLLAFTPCVLPMVPILAGLVAGHGTRLGTGRALLLSLVYVLASALVFTAAGVVAGVLGANLQAAFQAPWVLVAFAALFVALALSQFGLYELQLPHALRARLGAASDRQRGGSLAGVAAMGALSALIVGPCVAPPLAAAVLYIGQTHDPVLGGAALFLLAMGMGVPLLAFGAAAGRGMPTSGPWMTAVQRVFGFVFLGLAVWMLARILPSAATLALWGVLLLGAAAWALSATAEASRVRFGARFAGLVLAVAGAAELLGALGSGSDPLRPLAGAFGQVQVHAPAFQRIKSNADLDRELAAAQAAGNPVLFDFYADWCVSCKEMERDTFADPQVQGALAGFVLLQADVTANDDTDQALMRRFGIIGPPATLFFRAGQEVRGLRLVGYEKSAPFIARLRQAGR
ncbi:MAG: protein-disulfide reductase DsbD [Lysobacter sp.]|nr:protein-disulfide reductase DsbD [Lysobacter sp.]